MPDLQAVLVFEKGDDLARFLRFGAHLIARPERKGGGAVVHGGARRKIPTGRVARAGDLHHRLYLGIGMGRIEFLIKLGRLYFVRSAFGDAGKGHYPVFYRVDRRHSL